MLLAFVMGVACIALIGIASLILVGERAHQRARRWKAGLRELRGVLLHPGLFYHPGHTWILPQENGTVRIGLDDFGRRLVEGIQRVGLPAKGSRVHRGEAAIDLDCGQKHARLLSPIDGIVIDVNEKLARSGSSLERDPYGKGWLFKARVSDLGFTDLPTGNAAIDWMEWETGRLSMFLHGELGATAADGGDLVPRPPEMLSDDQWEHLVTAFFHTSAAGGEIPEQ